ncbi:hypothetical protein N825_25035 [Skermanella stibiiresistens SB22]|uniref:DUF3108 domain-containing protein n=1 Tax=Skermanella stibiiresistens SB22 TaxID=1385369 RepID=W9HAY5_9PROT|nr:DUF6134 family protein [Skermanella stibiiresistens]EWY41867.1 hypothetical protein N825_25035 [Skermanella stibiiresistens SB22]
MSVFRAAAILGLSVLVSSSVLIPTSSRALQAPKAALDFTVLRNGDEVGTQKFRFQPAAEGLNVAVDTNIVVKFALIPVYRFEHHAEEVWRGDQLVSLVSSTNDDGTRHTLKVTAGASQLDIEGDGKTSRMPGASIPASLWNPATVSQSTLLNTLVGDAMAVRLIDMGEEVVSVHGAKRPARHYAMTGDLARELWYDAAGSLVKVRFKAKDDSDIQYVLN